MQLANEPRHWLGRQGYYTHSKSGRTMYAAVDDRQELVIAARITEELCVDCQRTPRTTTARLTERMLGVEVTVTSERHAAPQRTDRVIAAVSRPLKHEHSHCSRIPAAAAASGGDVTREIEHGVEARVATLQRRQSGRRVDKNTRTT